MGPSPSWTPLSNLRLMTHYQSLCTGNLHTDQYLQWDSHHHLSAKFNAIHTLSHRASTVCSKPELLQQENDNPRKVLTNCKYHKWALDKMEKRLNRLSFTDELIVVTVFLLLNHFLTTIMPATTLKHQ